MTDIFSKAAKRKRETVRLNKVQANSTPKQPIQSEQVNGEAFTLLSDKLQKAVIYAAFYAVYQKSGTLYNQAAIDALLSNVGKALDDGAYQAFASNVGVIANALAGVQADIITPLSADDIIRDAMANAPNDETPKATLKRLIADKAITGADARRYLESLLGW